MASRISSPLQDVSNEPSAFGRQARETNPWERRSVISRVCFRDVDEGVAKGSGSDAVGRCCGVGERVHSAAFGRVPVLLARRDGDEPGLYVCARLADEYQAAAVVEDPGPVAVIDPTDFGVD